MGTGYASCFKRSADRVSADHFVHHLQDCIQGLAEAKETGDSQKFTDAVAEYDSLTRLDAWKTQLLLRVKKRLASVAEGEEEDLT